MLGYTVHKVPYRRLHRRPSCGTPFEDGDLLDAAEGLRVTLIDLLTS